MATASSSGRWYRPAFENLANRDITLLSAGVLVSIAGDSGALIALLLRLRPQGAGWVAALLGAELVPSVVASHWTGRLVDSHDKRRLLVFALSGQAVIAVPLALFHQPLLTVALFLVMATMGAVVRPATSALVPSLSGEEQKVTGYAWIATGGSLGWIIGPALGGLLTGAFGAQTTLLGDAGTFVVLTAACLALSVREAPPSEPLPKGRGSGGFSLIWGDLVLRTSIFVTALAVSCAVVDNVAAPYRFINQLGSSSFGYGSYLGIWGVGALLGTQLVRWIKDPARGLVVGNLLCAIGILGIGLAPDVPVAYVFSAFGGVGNGLENVAMSALVSGRIAANARGRAFATSGGIIQTGTGIGTAAGAPLVLALGAGHAMAGAGGLAAFVVVMAAPWSLVQRGPAQSPPAAESEVGEAVSI
jgi:MFS family permease